MVLLVQWDLLELMATCGQLREATLGGRCFPNELRLSVSRNKLLMTVILERKFLTQGC